MSLTIEEVEHIAHLARLKLSAEELEQYREQLSGILDHIAQLKNLDTSAVTPLRSILAERSPLREDKPGKSLSTPELLENAPSTAKQQFRVPPVLDTDES